MTSRAYNNQPHHRLVVDTPIVGGVRLWASDATACDAWSVLLTRKAWVQFLADVKSGEYDEVVR